MRLLIKEDKSSGAGGNRTSLPSQSTYEIPNGTITWITIIYLLINVGSSLLNTYVSTKQQKGIDSRSTEIINKNFELQILQRTLELENNEDRKTSLLLLIKMNLIGGKDNPQLYDYVKKQNNIPKWSIRQLEPLYMYNQTGNQNSPTVVMPDNTTIRPGLIKADTFKPNSPQSTQR